LPGTHPSAESSIDLAWYEYPPSYCTDEYVLDVSGGFAVTITASEYLPAPQSVQTEAPAAEYLPARQLSQVEATVAPTAVENFPAAQSMQVSELECWPAAQA
jgi:hypothetical protein